MSKIPTFIRFTVYQNQILKINQTIGDQKFLPNHLFELQKHYGDRGVPYYSLIHEGIQFHGYVGVLQITNTIYEILPFLEGGEVTIPYWRDVLSYMLGVVGEMEFWMQFGASPKKNHSILEPYFTKFLDEVEVLLHRGLIKNYSQKEENKNSLKGKLILSKQIQKNIIHKERMFVRHISYSQENILNSILYTALKWIEKASLSPEGKSRSKILLSTFPKMPPISLSEKLFSKIRFDRNTITYKNAITIAKFLLLKYSPGSSPVADGTISLLVDINFLWKKFIYKVLHKKSQLTHIHSLSPISRLQFWESENKKKIKFSYVVQINNLHSSDRTILESRWDCEGMSPNETTIKDLYIQAKLLGASKTILILPWRMEQVIPSRYKEMSPQSKIILTRVFDRTVDSKFLRNKVYSEF